MRPKLPAFSELEFSATRSQGPGGQNVNKVSSTSILYWDLKNTKSYTEEDKQILLRKLVSRINKEGFFYIRSSESRDYDKNKSTCLKKLKDLIEKAFFVPKSRIKTKPTFSSTQKRIKGKKIRSDIKNNRKKVID